MAVDLELFAGQRVDRAGGKEGERNADEDDVEHVRLLLARPRGVAIGDASMPANMGPGGIKDLFRVAAIGIKCS
jgi:hypothetical protein